MRKVWKPLASSATAPAGKIIVRYGLFLSVIRQGLFYIPFILTLPKLLGVAGIYASQPGADILTTLVCVLSIPAMKRAASRNMNL